MTTKQKNIMIGVNVYVLVFLMTFITRVTKAYIGMAYPNETDLAVQNLITYPSFFGMIASLLIGPIALKFSKVKLCQITMFMMFLHCVIYYITGLLHLPFFCLHIGGALGGIAIGIYITLLNSLIADHFPAEKRAECIAQYNVWINVGGVAITYGAGWLAASNDGASWHNAYLMGIACILGMIVFGIMCKKADAENPSIVSKTAQNEGSKLGIKDIPGKTLAWLLLMGTVHCMFYVTQNAFNVNVFIHHHRILSRYFRRSRHCDLFGAFCIDSMYSLVPIFKKYMKN